MKNKFMGTLLYRLFPKFDLKMKLTTFLLIVSLFEIQANTYAQGTKLTLEFDNVPVEQVFSEIEAISEFRFLYESAQIDLNRRVSLHLKKRKISEVLDLLFANTNISYKTVDRQIILTKKINTAIPPKIGNVEPTRQVGPVQFQVTGVITDADGVPLAGANIVEKGTTNGVTADVDGNFSITVANENATLVDSYIGYATKEIPVNGQTSVSVGLEADGAGLDEVVVVGCGTGMKKDLTGSVASVRGVDLEKTPSNAFVQALPGKPSGVDIRAASNAPGGGIRIRVRG